MTRYLLLLAMMIGFALPALADPTPIIIDDPTPIIID
jgi:hypothetical protein